MSEIRDFGKVAVLAGGSSNEREISLLSGRAVYDSLIRSGIDAAWLDVNESSLVRTMTEGSFDMAFIVLHGRFGEDGTVQGMLEELDIPYTGSGVKGSMLAIDKIASRKVFEKNGIRVPPYRVLKGGDTFSLSRIAPPVVVKPATEGSSIGLSLVKREAELARACEEAFKYGDRILIEDFIESREITVSILGDNPLSLVEIRPKNRFYDFESKYQNPATEYIVPARLPRGLSKKIQDIALAVHRALHLSDLSRVDMLVDSADNIFVLEANSIPGLTQRSLFPKAAGASGIDFDRLCLEILRLAEVTSGRKE